MTPLQIIEAMHKEARKCLKDYIADVGHDADQWTDEQIERVYFLTIQVKAARSAMAKVALRDKGEASTN